MSQVIQISEIQIIPVKPQDGLIAFASFLLDGKYYVGSVGVLTRLNGEGFRLAYPTKKLGEKSLNIFYPISASVGREIEEKVNQKVNEVLYGGKDKTI